jgi:hypothetical protein
MNIVRNLTESEADYTRGIVLPYILYNKKFEGTAGLIGGTTGYIQPQTRTAGSMLFSTNGSYMFSGIVSNIQPVPALPRLFLSPVFKFAWYDKNRLYRSGNPDYPDDIAGSNDSHEDNFIEGEGWGRFIRMEFKYLLPIGDARDRAVNCFVIDRGMLVSGAAGGKEYNPMTSGRTTVEMTPFYHYYSYDNKDMPRIKSSSNGVKLTLKYDNRDFYENPSRGSVTRFAYARDFGLFDSSDTWTTVEFEFSKYISIPRADWMRQSVIALDFWTIDTPGWETREDASGGSYVIHRPPQELGARLGGFYRLRAYPEYRFNSRAAIYYSAEYRFVPDWEPLDRSSWLGNILEWDYLQIAPFVEMGRVNENWDITDLHSRMKWDAGIGLRAYMRKLTIRLDTAFSDEDASMVIWVLQPFQASF